MTRKASGCSFNLLMNCFLAEWLHRLQELQAGEITSEEYTEWKLNWPRTSDDCGRVQAEREWRKIE